MTHFTPAAVDAWTECVQDLTNGYFDVAQKWLSGSLTMNDVADYTTRVGGELASSPWKYLQAMTTPRPPGKPGEWHMSAPRPQLQRPASVARGYVDQINAIAQDAARRDNAGKWGIDGWVRLIHNLLDLQMRTYAGAVQVALAGP